MSAEQIDYSEALQSIIDKLDMIYGMLFRINYGSEQEGLIGITELSDHVDKLGSGMKVELYDYSSQIEAISKLLAWTDILLIVLLVLFMLCMGCFVGYQVTQWMKTRTS